jgi:hypothetical protein
MKAFKILMVIALLSTPFASQAQGYYEDDNYYDNDRLGLPGDNLNLYAVMRLFQNTATLEEFEYRLNSKSERINNLDLNMDNRIDYIKVIDYMRGDDHYIVLRVALNRRENQDVAVINVTRDRRDRVYVQLIGDEDLYGYDYIIEPNYDDYDYREYRGRVNIGGFTVTINTTSPYKISSWPIIRYLYRPDYIVWVSPFRWGYYPREWKPWRPYYWDYYYGYHYNWYKYYYGNYRRWNNYRNPHWKEYYYREHRNNSDIVYRKRQSGSYERTYGRPDQREEGVNTYIQNNRNDNNIIRPQQGSVYRRETPRQENNTINDRTRSNDNKFENRPQVRREENGYNPERRDEKRGSEVRREEQSRRSEPARNENSRSENREKEKTKYNRPSTPPPAQQSQQQTQQSQSQSQEGSKYRR